MRPRGHDVEACEDVSSDSASDTEPAPHHHHGGVGGGDEEWCVEDGGSVTRALGALDALRKAREHYDVLLTCDDGGDTPAHRALLAAHSPHLLRVLPACSGTGAPTVCRVLHVQTEALCGVVQWCYSGRIAARTAAQGRALYAAAWTLRMECARLLVADRLIRRLAPATALSVRALPDLPPRHAHAASAYIAQHFDEICSSGCMSSLPLLRVDLVSSSSATGGLEAAGAVADAILQWLRERHADTPIEQLCARAHLVYVDSAGSIQDCDQLPNKQANGTVIAEYRAAAGAAGAGSGAGTCSDDDDDDRAAGELVLGGRTPKPEWEVVAAAGAAGVTRAALVLHGRLVGCRLAWRDVGSEVVVGGPLGGAAEAAAGGERRAPLCGGRAAAGGVHINGRLVVAGGYDRAQVLKEVVSYEPATNQWSSLPSMKVPRARFPAAILHHTLYVIGGSDGHNELDSVHAYTQSEESMTGTWRAVCPLPSPLCLAGGVAAGGGVWLVGGLAGGKPLKATHRYNPEDDQWTPGPPLNTARSQVSLVQWRGALWTLGGCDAWHCLASTETLQLDDSGMSVEAWSMGPALPTARRSVGAAVWRDTVYCAGGSDGVASLSRCDRMRPSGGGGALQWETAPSMRRGRAAAALVAMGEVLYAVGGFDGKEFLSCVECLYEEGGEWTSLCSPPPLTPTLSPVPPTKSCEATSGDASDDRADRPEHPPAPPHLPPAAPAPPAAAAVNGDGPH